MSDVVFALFVSLVLWHAICRAREQRTRNVARELRKILLGTIRPDPEAPPIELTFHAIHHRVKEPHAGLVRQILEALVKEGILTRRLDPLGRRHADFYALSLRGCEDMRKSITKGGDCS